MGRAEGINEKRASKKAPVDVSNLLKQKKKTAQKPKKFYMMIHSFDSALTPTKPISANVVGCLLDVGAPA